MPALSIDTSSTALVLIDLQRGIVGMTSAPHDAASVVAHAASVARRFRERRALVLGRISTNIGVEAPARAAHERGFEQIFVEDAMAAREADLHEHAVRRFFPTIGRVRSAAEVIEALG